MEEGLLWYDRELKKALVAKIDQAATRYQAKFGQKPTVCYLNRADLEDPLEEVHGIRLRVAPDILPYHLWLGVE